MRNQKGTPVSQAYAYAKLASTLVAAEQYAEAIKFYKLSISLCQPTEEKLKLAACAAVCNIYATCSATESFLDFIKEHRLLPEIINIKRLKKFEKAYIDIFKAAGTIYRITGDLKKAKHYLIMHLSLAPDNFDALFELINVYAEETDWPAALQKSKEAEDRLNALESQGVTVVCSSSILIYKVKVCEKYGLIYQGFRDFSMASKYYLRGLKFISEERSQINGMACVNTRKTRLINLNNLHCALGIAFAVMKVQVGMPDDGDPADIKMKFAHDLSFTQELINTVKKSLEENKKTIDAKSPSYDKVLNYELRVQVVEAVIATYTCPDSTSVDVRLTEIAQKLRQSSIGCDLSSIALMMKVLLLRGNYKEIIALKDYTGVSANHNILVVSQALGAAYYNIGNFREALLYFENLMVIDENGDLANFIANLYCMLGEFSESRRYYRIALKYSTDKHLYELQIKIADLFGFFVFKGESSELKPGKLKNFLKIAKQLFEEFPELYSDNYVRDPSSPYYEAILLLILVKDICKKSELWDKIKSLRTEAEIEAITPADEERCVDAFKIEREALIQKIKEYCYKDREGSPVFPDPLKRSPKPAKEETKSAHPQPGDEGVFLFKAMPADSGKQTYSWFDVNRLRKVISDDNIERAKRLVINCEKLLEDDGKDKPGVKRDNYNFFIKLPDESRIQGMFIMLGSYNIITYDKGFSSHVAYEKARQAGSSNGHQIKLPVTINLCYICTERVNSGEGYIARN